MFLYFFYVSSETVTFSFEDSGKLFDILFLKYFIYLSPKQQIIPRQNYTKSVVR